MIIFPSAEAEPLSGKIRHFQTHTHTYIYSGGFVQYVLIEFRCRGGAEVCKFWLFNLAGLYKYFLWSFNMAIEHGVLIVYLPTHSYVSLPQGVDPSRFLLVSNGLSTDFAYLQDSKGSMHGCFQKMRSVENTLQCFIVFFTSMAPCPILADTHTHISWWYPEWSGTCSYPLH